MQTEEKTCKDPRRTDCLPAQQEGLRAWARAYDNNPVPGAGGSSLQGKLIAALFYFTLTSAIVYLAYRQCLCVSFLLDDYKHLGFAHDIFTAKSPIWPLWQCLNKSWVAGGTGQTDGLTSFRPGVSVSYLFDYWLFGFNAAGYHADNLLIFTLTSWVVGFLSTQMAPFLSFKRRVLGGVLASVLFLLFPIHPEAVAWVVGRVDVYCAFFYLFSLSLYFHHRRSGSFIPLAGSLMAYFCALSCKEMALSLPAVVAVGEFLLPEALGWKKLTWTSRLWRLASYALLLMAFLCLRTLAIGTLVGGYGETTVRSFTRALKNFLDVASLQKILFGVNEEKAFPAPITASAYAAWLILAVSFAGRLLQPLSRLRLIAFAGAFMILAEIPTFQIWHIYPNLVGSRLFYLGSAALCLLLAVTFVPVFTLAAPIRRLIELTKASFFKARLNEGPAAGSRQSAAHLLRVAAVSGRTVADIIPILALLVLACTWYAALEHNLSFWVEAGNQMTRLRETLSYESKATGQAQSLILLDLPQDYCGAGLVGRPELLIQMMSRPVADDNYASKIVSLERPIPGSREFACPGLISAVCGDWRTRRILIWSRKARGYIPWHKPDHDFDSSERFIPVSSNEGVIRNPRTPRIIWLIKNGHIDPFGCAWFQAIFKTNSNNACLSEDRASKSRLEELAGHVRLVWRSEQQPDSWIDYSEGPFPECSDGKLVFIPFRYRSWLLNGPIVDLGLQILPGEYLAEFDGLRTGGSSLIMPEITLKKAGESSVQDMVLPEISMSDTVTVSYDVSKISGARGALLLVTKSDQAFADLPVHDCPFENMLVQMKLSGLIAICEIPKAAIKQPGKHQVAIAAIDGGGNIIGYISEPRTFLSRP